MAGYPEAKAATLPLAASGMVKNEEIGEEKTQKDYYDRATHYNAVWGQDNIHLGYYPHIAGKDLVVLTNVQASDCLTKRMIEVGKINHRSTVLDLGCGKGQAARVIAEHTGAAVTGIDLSTGNIERANEVAGSLPHLKLKFYEGSFTELPAEVLSQKYSVIFSQVAFCHVHQLLPLIFKEAQKVLAPDGVLVVNDYLSGKKKPSEMTRANVHKRLHFDHLHTHKEWRRLAEEAGFVIEFYEDLDKHMAQTYRDMERKAREVGFVSADGVLLADNYAMTYKAIDEGEVGMNLALLVGGLPKAPETLVDTSKVYLQRDGVFSRVRFFEGDVVEKGLARRLPEGFEGCDGSVPWSADDKRAMVSGAAMFYKRCDEPNCVMQRNVDDDCFEIVALRDIAQDEVLSVGLKGH